MSSVTIHRPTRSDRRTAPANGVESTTPAHGFGDPTHRSDKITDGHWQRLAIVYVRQSTQHQVLEHRESTARQYALADRAVALGWPAAAVVVIDEDQGHSSSSAEGRSGFQRLLAEVSADRVGLILGLEMSRLARSCKDWHTLLDLCAIYRTLLADADGLYDPSQYNDRLLLGLKGTMSEAELHILKSRLQQGMWNKAARGAVLNHPPIGYVRTVAGDFVIDPDEQVQAVVRLIFEQFARRGSINGLLKWLVRHDVKAPIRPHSGVNRGQLEWRRPNRVTLLNLLHHPIYAGAYRWGQREVDPFAGLVVFAPRTSAEFTAVHVVTPGGKVGVHQSANGQTAFLLRPRNPPGFEIILDAIVFFRCLVSIVAKVVQPLVDFLCPTAAWMPPQRERQLVTCTTRFDNKCAICGSPGLLLGLPRIFGESPKVKKH